MNKGLTLKMGQTHVQAYTKPLLKVPDSLTGLSKDSEGNLAERPGVRE